MSALQYDGFDTELAMAYGDVFSHAEVSAFALADFATRCGVVRKLMRREGQRLATLATAEATAQAQAAATTGGRCCALEGRGPLTVPVCK